MASVDGSKSLQISSDDSLEFECSPCNNDGIKKKATFYCINCKDYLCKPCHEFHQKLSLTRKHQVVSGSWVPQKEEATKSEEINKETRFQCCCNRQAVTHYCRNHNDVFCIECKTLKHRKCRTSTIDEAVDELKTSKIESSKEIMDSLREKLEMLQKKRQKDMEVLTAKTSECRKSLEVFKEEVIQKVENMTKNTLDDIEACNEIQRETIGQHIHTCSVALNKLISEYGAFEETKTSGEKRDIFVHDLLLKRTIGTMNQILFDIEREIMPSMISFQCNKTLQSLHMNSLGVIWTLQPAQVPGKAELSGPGHPECLKPMPAQPASQALAFPGQKPLTASMLAAAPPQEQKVMLGERLFPLIQRMHPDLAAKITGVLLEIDNSELLHMLESAESLKAKGEMASVDGSQSSQLSSDESFEFECSPCNYDGTRKKATFYCSDCEEYLCKLCQEVHQKLSSTRKHQVVSQSLVPPKGEAMKSQETNTETRYMYQCFCNRQDVTHYCKDHIEVVCIECKTLKHRNCQTSTVDEACDGLDATQNDSTKEKLDSLREKLEKLQKKRHEDMEILTAKKVQSQKSLEVFKKEVVDQAEKKMEKLLDDIEISDCVQRLKIEQHIQTCSVALNKLTVDYSAFEETKISGEKRYVFIHSIIFKKTMDTVNQALLDIEKELRPPIIAFQHNETLQNLCMNSLGVIKSDPIECKVVADMKIKSVEKVDVKFSEDKNEPWINGSLFIDSGELVLCDRNNSSIKVLSVLLTPKEQIQLPSSPREVALMHDRDVIVTLPKIQSMQFVKLYPNLQLGPSIALDQVCLGVAVIEESIYMSLENGTVQVMDREGKQKTRIFDRYKFYCPQYLSVFRTSLCVSDRNFIGLYDHGTQVYKYKDSALDTPSGTYIDGGDNVFVCGFKSNNIHVIDKSGRKKNILLSETDGLSEPSCISFRAYDNMFVVGGRAQRKLIVCKMCVDESLGLDNEVTLQRTAARKKLCEK